MENFYDYKKYAILYVDDEEKSLKYFSRGFRDKFRIFTAASAQEGYRVFEENKDDIGLLLTDQRMPGEKGVQLLEKVRQLRPRTIRILVTAYSDIDAAIDAVNSGAIYKYIRKPWDMAELEVTLKRGLEFFMVQQERDQLMREKLSVLHDMMITDRVISLGVLASGLGHYVRNSLVAVRTFLDLAPEKLQEENLNMERMRNPNFWTDFYDHVQQQIQRIGDLLGSLVEVSEHTTSPFRDEVHLDDVINRARETVAERLTAKEIKLKSEIAPDLPAMVVDGTKFTRLFELLLYDEAINLPAGSQITLEARQLARKELVGKGDEEQPPIQIEIRDDGPGLPKDALRSVFDPFFLRSDDQQEFGINLMICYFIVYHHGGQIEAEEPEGPGTLFRITLPVKPSLRSPVEEEHAFVSKVLMNERLWEKMLAGQ